MVRLIGGGVYSLLSFGYSAWLHSLVNGIGYTLSTVAAHPLLQRAQVFALEKFPQEMLAIFRSFLVQAGLTATADYTRSMNQVRINGNSGRICQ